jgi:hypothetical protein
MAAEEIDSAIRMNSSGNSVCLEGIGCPRGLTGLVAKSGALLFVLSSGLKSNFSSLGNQLIQLRGFGGNSDTNTSQKKNFRPV